MTIHFPGSTDYRRATTPHNAIVRQRPRAVATVLDAVSACAAVDYASTAGLRVAVQSTGHGVAEDLADDTLLADTSRLDHVVVNPQDRTARVGAGALWRAVNAAAEPHGLLAAAGSAPDVGVAGYTFGGGVGWLTPAFGLASNALLSVTYVDGAGSARLASEDADDEVDREALWAFRGGGGVGLAVELRFELFPVTEVWAGYQLWPAEHLESVVQAWAAGLSSDTEVATSLSILHAPPGPPFPASLQGRPVIHLAMAAPRGARSADGLRAALAGAPTPVVDTWGPADAATLAGIHLDPPTGAPALGMGRWVGAATPQRALRILQAAAASETLSVVELRNVGSTTHARPGALTSPPGPFLAASVGVVPIPQRRALVSSGLQQLRTSLADIDVGRGAANFAVGQRGDLDALVPEDRGRLDQIRTAVDPTGVFHPSRVSGTNPFDPGEGSVSGMAASDLTATRDLLRDLFTRLIEHADDLTDGLTDDVAYHRPTPEANTISWLLWHSARVQDSQLSAVAGVEQVWVRDGWDGRFALDLPNDSSGYGHSPEQVAKVRASAELLVGYYRAVHAMTLEFVASVTAEELERIVDKRWTPPVTASARIVSVIDDCAQHLGQAAYIRSLVT